MDELLDDVWSLYRELDDRTPMWESDLDQIERWVSSSTAHTASVRARCEQAIGELEAAVSEADTGRRVSLLTAAAALRSLAATADTGVELSLTHPEQGLLGLLHWAVPGYALTTEAHGERYLDKLRRFPAAIDELGVRLREAAAADRAPLRRHADAAVAKLDTLLASDVAEDPLLAQAPPTELDDAGADRFRGEVAELVRSRTRPALSRYRDVLAAHSVPAGRDDDHPGLVHHPGGEEAYAEHLAAYTRPGTTAEELHARGVEQLARLDEEWAALGQEEFGVSDPSEVRRLVAALGGRATAEDVLRDATAIHEQATAEAPAWFRRVPASPCVVRTTEHGALAFYSPPTEDGSRPGITYFNVGDPGAWGPQLAATVVHEGVPGHHYQLALALEQDDLHELHRRLFLAAFGEGWALYVERIGEEMGLYPTTVDRLGMLSSDALRAARLVVDTGLHALGWTRRQAIDVLVERTGLGVGECTAEIDRYIAVPGQATSYMTGRLAIVRLREEARERLGGGFDVATFHDVVLSRGMVSLDALDVLVEDWLTSSTTAG